MFVPSPGAIPSMALACMGLLGSILAAPARADSSFGSETLEDVKLYFTAPIRWDAGDWAEFTTAVAAVGVAYAFDGRVRHHFAKGPKDGLNGGKDLNATRDALPAVALVGGTFLVAGYFNDSDGYRETWSLLEAGILSTVTGEALSYAVGRQRPDGTTHPNSWRSGHDSFPSVHATAAFAIGTTFAESGNDEYRWLRRIIGYSVAGYTAYERVKENVHWTSDTVAGAALGIATAQFVIGRRDHPWSTGSLDVQPVKNGWQASYTVKFR